ncbi:MAG: DNA topoisomerase, partial [Anaerovoracaceae bacterium]
MAQKADKEIKKTNKSSKKSSKKTEKVSKRIENLVIVESPSKGKTISKFLGSKYKVVASVGHIRDLPKSKIGVNIENDFEPEYINIRGKGDLIKSLKKEAELANKVYLATDPDREGEAIAWHLAYILGIDEKEKCRIAFNEITQKSVREAVKEAREIDIKLVDAQQARRVLDRLVGYKLSPILWNKVRRGLSAGRVQSAALKIICDREDEIKAFIPKEFWNVDGYFPGPPDFSARLNYYKDEKFELNTKEETDKVLSELEQQKYIVGKVEEKQRQRKPYAPFTTSNLQQDAAHKLNFYSKKTMQIAQQLY